MSQLLTQLLADHSPEFGARLKQRLNALLVEHGQSRLNERALGFRRFQEYLERAHGDLVHIERPREDGDILVSLKSAQTPSPHRADTLNKATGARAPIRNEVWQAFTNPDSSRKRFLHKQSRAVKHFVEGQPSGIPDEISVAASDFIEIKPIEGATQLGWMTRFLNEIDLPASERVVFDAMLNEEYSSSVNSTFTRALGDHGDAWRQFRTKLVTEHISTWASQHSVPMSDLRASPKQRVTAKAEGQPSTQLSAREQVLRLLDLISDEDVTRLVLPTLLSTILIKSRI
ncbi:hypothetical protein [Burkholderia ubonensis]|uniref:hypothetical protein n=1 Tax=Burkholderia ubonensis TaxID=101571 RepID=UPI0012F9C610|nr:hypothetical protein [Burkholderia ubonensis]